jgi:hypothetical protein
MPTKTIKIFSSSFRFANYSTSFFLLSRAATVILKTFFFFSLSSVNFMITILDAQIMKYNLKDSGAVPSFCLFLRKLQDLRKTCIPCEIWLHISTVFLFVKVFRSDSDSARYARKCMHVLV